MLDCFRYLDHGVSLWVRRYFEGFNVYRCYIHGMDIVRGWSLINGVPWKL